MYKLRRRLKCVWQLNERLVNADIKPYSYYVQIIYYGNSTLQPCYKMQLHEVLISLKLSYFVKINNCDKWINIVPLEDRGNS